MKISREWLQTYFEKELPNAEALSDALTFHAFEIDGIEKIGSDSILDVKVTPNRGHDCLSHRGVAKELSAILQLPLKSDPLTDIDESRNSQSESKTWPSGLERSSGRVSAEVSVSINSPLCSRYIAGHIKGVKVALSPAWLKERLEAVGQRSINNVVDATNYVMFDLGQPLHAFDAGKLVQKEGRYAVGVRAAKAGEKLFALDEKEYLLNESMLVIVDENKGEAIGIAGVKGGMPAGISEETHEIIIESANFDGPTVRRAAQELKLRTDASARFEQVISPELAAYAMQAVVDLILELAGGEFIGVTDVYPKPQEKKEVSVSVTQVKNLLGDTFGEKEIKDSFNRLGFSFQQNAELFSVEVPFERLDLEIPEDLVEEVGRIQGYDKIPPIELPPFSKPVEINKNFYWSEKIREYLVAQGFSEVFTSVFAEKGERIVLNKVDGVKPYLRTNLADGLTEALERNMRNKELLGLAQVKLFEIGAIWKGGKEEMVYDLAVEKIKKGKTADEYRKELDAELKNIPEALAEYENLPLSQTERYQPFSKYPYIVRDLAVWKPEGSYGMDEDKIEEQIKAEAGELCVKISRFDRFEKEGRVSLAYRLIFQSFDRTLTDGEVNAAMECVYGKKKEQGFEIR